MDELQKSREDYWHCPPGEAAVILLTNEDVVYPKYFVYLVVVSIVKISTTEVYNLLVILIHY